MLSAPPAGERALVRALGTWTLAASIVNVTVGGGIFGLPATVAAQLGAAAPLAYLVCAGAMALIVLCFAEAGSRVSLTGGPYAYVEVAFGPFVGFLAGVLLWLLGTFAVAAVASLFAGSVGALVPGAGAGAARALLLVALFATLAAVNVRGLRQGTRLITVATIAKLLPLLLLVLVGAFFVRPENLAVSTLPSAGQVARTSIVLIFAFSGIESALVPSGEVRDTARTVPRAIAIAMAGVTVLYIAIQLVAQGLLSSDMATYTETPLAAAAARFAGTTGSVVMLVGASVSMFGYVSGMTLAIPRALFAFARDGILPAKLAAVHPRFHTPHVAIVVQSVLVCVLAISGSFAGLAIIANVAALLLYLACCVAGWELRRRDVRAAGTPFELPGGPAIPVAACAVIVWLLASITLREWAVVAGVLVAATALFFISGVRRRQLGEA